MIWQPYLCNHLFYAQWAWSYLNTCAQWIWTMVCITGLKSSFPNFKVLSCNLNLYNNFNTEHTTRSTILLLFMQEGFYSMHYWHSLTRKKACKEKSVILLYHDFVPWLILNITVLAWKEEKEMLQNKKSRWELKYLYFSLLKF